MSRNQSFFALSVSLVAVTGLAIVGCNQSSTTSKLPENSVAAGNLKTSKTVQNKPAEVEHPHIAGAHGGIVIPIGSDSYHAEAVIEKDGQFRLLMLGADETRIQEVDVQAVKAYIKAAGDTDATPIDMKAVPQDGDASGKTSQFVGLLPESAIGKAIDVTIPNLRIGTERFRVGFTTAVQQHDNGMPAAVSGAEEQKLYFTPGGKYTQADIDANGKLSAGAKFRGFMSKHDMSPKPGDIICPVTFTKANPKIEWQVDGKKYLFCCPPCVDEFVRMSKEEPDSLKAPEDYIQGAKQSSASESVRKEQTSAKATASDASLDPEIAEALAGMNKEDRSLVDSQKYCAIMTDSLLGSMGAPLKVEVNGEPVFLCCKGCKAKALRDPEATLATVAKLRGENGGKR
jgi:YHS domain-containing protein